MKRCASFNAKLWLFIFKEAFLIHLMSVSVMKAPSSTSSFMANDLFCLNRGNDFTL